MIISVVLLIIIFLTYQQHADTVNESQLFLIFDFFHLSHLFLPLPILYVNYCCGLYHQQQQHCRYTKTDFIIKLLSPPSLSQNIPSIGFLSFFSGTLAAQPGGVCLWC